MNIRNINITNGYFNFDQNKFLLEKMKSAKLSLKKPNFKTVVKIIQYDRKCNQYALSENTVYIIQIRTHYIWEKMHLKHILYVKNRNWFHPSSNSAH